MQPLGDGVYLAGLAQPTQRQRWWAAVLSQPGHRAQSRERRRVLRLRPVVGAPSRSRESGTVGASTAADSSSATRSRCAARSPSTTASRSPPSSARSSIYGRTCPRGRARGCSARGSGLASTTAPRMLAAIRAHRRRRGVASLRAAVEQLGGLRLDRCRSDPEAWAVALIADAGLAAPSVNERVAGEEADLSWPAARLIVELDGPSYHVLRDEDIRKMKAWQSGGLRRPAPPHRRRLPRARTASGPRAADERRSYPVMTWEDRRSTLPAAPTGRWPAPPRGSGRGRRSR